MRISIVLAVLALSFAIYASHCDFAFAQTPSTTSGDIELDELGTLDESGAVEIGESLIAPNSPLYFLKAIRERIEDKFASSRETKAIIQVEFAHRRIRELRALVKNNHQDLIPPVMEKYKAHIQDAAGTASHDEELAVRVGESVSRHLDVLQRVYDQVGNPRAKAAIRAAIEKAEEHNRTLLSKLSLVNQQQLIRKVALRQALVCRFFEREASSSASNDTEREYMRKRVRVCKEDINKNLRDELMEIKQKRQTSSDETKNWKTYTNPTAKFSINYPEVWSSVNGGSLDTGTDTTVFGPNVKETVGDANTKVWVQVHSSKSQSPIKNAEDYKNSIIRGRTDPKISSIIIDGVSGFKASYVDAGVQITNVIVDKNGLIYSIALRQVTPRSDQDIQTYNQILATFRFE